MTKEEFILAVKGWYLNLTGNEDFITFLGRLYDEVVQPHWISVEDELPKDYVEVIVALNNHFVFTAFKCGDTWNTNDPVSWREIKGVTHWMHLPQAPKKGGEE